MSAVGAACDVAIVGAGPAGLAAAIAISRQGRSVLVADARPAERDRIGESCPPDLLMCIEQLGLTRRFRAGGHRPFPGYTSVWGRAAPGHNDFIVSPLGPAWRLDRPVFDRMLAEAAEESGAELRWSLRFTEARRIEGGFELDFEQSTRTVRAGFVIDASGARARLARSLGVRRHTDDTLLAWVRFSRIIDGHLTRRVLIEAAPEGWWYAARLPDGRLVDMLVTDKATLSALRATGRDTALRQTTLVGPALDGLTLAEPHDIRWPIDSGRLEQVEGDGWMAIGDAAASFDPIAAQGVYKALQDGLAAGRAVAGSQDEHTPAVEARVRDYRRARAHLYGLEQRWPEAPFWRGRQRAVIGR